MTAGARSGIVPAATTSTDMLRKFDQKELIRPQN